MTTETKNNLFYIVICLLILIGLLYFKKKITGSIMPIELQKLEQLKKINEKLGETE